MKSKLSVHTRIVAYLLVSRYLLPKFPLVVRIQKFSPDYIYKCLLFKYF